MTNTFLPMLKSTQCDQHEDVGKGAEAIVINISSTLASLTEAPRYATTSYQCSKAAVNMLTKCQADAVPTVKFVAVHPGWVNRKDRTKSFKSYVLSPWERTRNLIFCNTLNFE